MPSTPTWQAATSGQRGSASHVNQFLGAHTAQIIYPGTSRASVLTNGSTTSFTNGTYLAQSFTTAVGQTTIGYVQVPVTCNTSTGTALVPTTLSLYASSGTAPTGSALISVTLVPEYVYPAANLGNTNTMVTIPMPITGLTASTQYWLVLASASTGSFNYSWFRSASASGASTSNNGTTWVAQAYGFRYNVFDKVVTNAPLWMALWEDNGARWVINTRNSVNNLITTYAEYTAGQTTTGYLASYRSFTFTNGLLTGVA